MDAERLPATASYMSALIEKAVREVRDRVVDDEILARQAVEATLNAIEDHGHEIMPAGSTRECICPKCGVRHGLQTEVPDDQQF